METATYNELEQNTQEANAHMEVFSALGQVVANNDDPDEVYERLATEIQEGVLEIAVQRTLRIVLGTGGPHTEIRWPENKQPSIVCYGWFGAGKFERELTADELAGLEYALGDWEELNPEAE